MSLRLVLVSLRFLFFLISFLSLRHGDPPVCSLMPHSSTAGEQLSCISPVPTPACARPAPGGRDTEPETDRAGARAAAGDAGDRVPQRFFARRVDAASPRVSQGPLRSRLE